jgi:hypothetical protein
MEEEVIKKNLSAGSDPQSSNIGGTSAGVWNKILATVLKMPGVKVDRVSFLRKELKNHCNQQKLDMLANVRPYTIVSDKTIDSVAAFCINRHTVLATTGSTIAGLPGGLAMMATIPSDLTQYYYHVVVLSQKLAYLYGFPDFCNEQGELSDVAGDLLTIFMGSMMGVRVADHGINELARGMAKSAVGRLPRVALTKAAVYPIAAQVAKMVGMKLTKDGFTKTVGRFIPIAGGIFSGTLTLLTFKPGARRLQKRLKAQKKYFKDYDADTLESFWKENGEAERVNIRSSFVKAEQTQDDPRKMQLAVVQAMINMANISEDLTADVQDLIEDRIAELDLSDAEQLSLLETLGTEFSYDIDYDLLSCNSDYATETLRGMISVMRAAGRQTMAEKMYLSMAAKTLGVSKEELDTLISD